MTIEKRSIQKDNQSCDDRDVAVKETKIQVKICLNAVIYII